MTANDHPGIELQDLLDGVLDEARRGAIEAHVGVCAACAEELALLRAGRGAARSMHTEVPEGLDRRVLAALDEEDRAASAATSRAWRWVAAAAIVVVGVGLAVVFTSSDPERQATAVAAPDLADDIAVNFVDLRDGRLDLAVATRDPESLEEYFRQSGIGHDVRVLDLAMMEYGVDGGSVLDTDPPRAVYVYDGPGDVRLMCQMFLLDYAALPKGGELRTHNGIDFVIYERRGVTLVFWMEGDVMCALSSDIGREEVIRLALAKAMAAVRQGV